MFALGLSIGATFPVVAVLRKGRGPRFLLAARERQVRYDTRQTLRFSVCTRGYLSRHPFAAARKGSGFTLAQCGVSYEVRRFLLQIFRHLLRSASFELVLVRSFPLGPALPKGGPDYPECRGPKGITTRRQ